MPATEIFQKILTAVSAETEIEPQVILSENKETDVVDARFILIHLLLREGFSAARIARLTGRTARAVSYVNNRFDARLRQSRYMRSVLETVRKHTENTSDNAWK